MRYAVIEDGKVVNIVEATAPFAEAQGWVLAEEAGTIGDLYENGQFTPGPPPPPPPQPTKEDLLAQLQALQAQISALP